MHVRTHCRLTRLCMHEPCENKRSIGFGGPYFDFGHPCVLGLFSQSLFSMMNYILLPWFSAPCEQLFRNTCCPFDTVEVKTEHFPFLPLFLSFTHSQVCSIRNLGHPPLLHDIHLCLFQNGLQHGCMNIIIHHVEKNDIQVPWGGLPLKASEPQTSMDYLSDSINGLVGTGSLWFFVAKTQPFWITKCFI